MSSLKGKLNQEIQGKVTRWASKQQKTNKDPKTNKKLTQKSQNVTQSKTKNKEKISKKKSRKILTQKKEKF
jgi:hypothetical protein